MYRFSSRASCASPKLSLLSLTLAIIILTPKPCVQDRYLSTSNETNKVLTDEIVAHIPGGENNAYQLAVEHNLEYVSQASLLYQFNLSLRCFPIDHMKFTYRHDLNLCDNFNA